MTLDQVLTDAKEHANALRLHGHRAQAKSLDALVDAIELAAADYLTWLSESEALLRSDWKTRRLRSHFTEWVAQGMAEKRGRVRWYRQVMIPQRPNAEAAQADAERMARAS